MRCLVCGHPIPHRWWHWLVVWSTTWFRVSRSLVQGRWLGGQPHERGTLPTSRSGSAGPHSVVAPRAERDRLDSSTRTAPATTLGPATGTGTPDTPTARRAGRRLPPMTRQARYRLVLATIAGAVCLAGLVALVLALP